MAHCLACACAHCMQPKKIITEDVFFWRLYMEMLRRKFANFDVILSGNLTDVLQSQHGGYEWRLHNAFSTLCMDDVVHIWCWGRQHSLWQYLYSGIFHQPHGSREMEGNASVFPARDDRGFFPELCLPDTICQSPWSSLENDPRGSFMVLLIWICWHDSLQSIYITNWIVRISQRNPRKCLGLCCVASSRKRRQGVGLLQGDSLEKSCHGGHQIVGRNWIFWIQMEDLLTLWRNLKELSVDIRWYSWIHSWIHSFCFQVWSQPYIIDALYI